MVWIIIIVLVFLAGIILLNSNVPSREPTREQFLRSMEKILEGKLRPVEGQPENFQIDFFFEGQAFVYEDVIDRGFKEAARKGYLKTRIHADFSLYFSEKPRSTTMKTDVFISSQIPDGPTRPDAWVALPPSLKGLDVQTNNIRLANKLLANPKIVDVLLEFRSVDSRGHPSMSWKIMDGLMILEFHSAERKIPNYHDLTSRISSVDDYLEELTKIVRFFKEP
ncbi:MAG: hypothetical protein A2705_03420 [Omnitrophica WOR_2 bacterium RIFCSPHIGHO2_01_FULL_52_10]|nr:MAG: hypothetical protein A2705_03420 [Omnitrophica WOR_2 bacterium RIFCSPHIGHO2_01_FULL_52_10]